MTLLLSSPPLALGTHLDHDAALVVADAEAVRAPLCGDAPDPVETVVECILQAVGVGVPHFYRAVLGARQQDW